MRKRSPSASITRNVLQPIEPVEPKIATPLLFIYPRPISQFRFVRIKQLDGLPCFVGIFSAGHTPLLAVSINQVNPGLHFFPGADHAEIESRGAIAVLNGDVAGDKPPKILYLADIL